MNMDDRALTNARNFLAAREPRRDLAKKDKNRNKDPIDVNDCIMEFSIESPNSKNDSHHKNMSMLIR